MEMKKVLLSPLDPVHDIGLKMIKRGLEEKGHQTVLLQPDLKPEEIIQVALDENVDVMLLSRTLGYGVAELLSRFIDLSEAAGLRERVRIGIGGMAIKPELAAELGFDGGFGPGTTVEESIAFVEGCEYNREGLRVRKEKKDFVSRYDYTYNNQMIEELLDQIVDKILMWALGKTSTGIQRAKIREEMLEVEDRGARGSMDALEVESAMKRLRAEYAAIADQEVAKYYLEGVIPSKLRPLSEEEVRGLRSFVARSNEATNPHRLQHREGQPVTWVQYGTGCPFMDIAHVKVSEAWGADGVVHFDPAWAARTEGFYGGFLTHEENGSVVTWENLKGIKESLLPSTLWQVRAHRGLNTPETVLLAAKAGADMTKINIAYGALGGGTDPERLTIDALEAIRLAAKYDLPYDMPTNEELCGVPAYKAFAGMLVTTHLGIRLGARPILQPLFCYSPEMMIHGQMEDNYVDYNAAKIFALRNIINAPIWAGAPIGFLTQTEERVQSSVSTGLHAALAAALGVDAISIASSDEAYSGGPIAAPSRVDTLQAVQENFRFHGSAKVQPTERAVEWARELEQGITQVLKDVAAQETFVEALYQGYLGSKAEGAYPGRAGKGTVKKL